MSSRFALQVDSVDVSDTFVAVGLSNLEGNIWDGAIKLLSIENGQELHSVHCDCGVAMVRFAGQNKNFLLAARDDGHVALYAASSLDPLLQLPAHSDYVSCVAVHESSETEFVSSGWDGAIKLWDWQAESRATPVLTIGEAHYKHVNEVAISPLERSLLASVGQDGFLRLWDRRTDVDREGCVQLFRHSEAVGCVAWDASNANLVYTGSDAGDVTAFDLRMTHVSDGAASTTSVEACCSSEHRVHRGRVRRLTTLRGHPGLVVSCSDDTTVAVTRVSLSADEALGDDASAEFAETAR